MLLYRFYSFTTKGCQNGNINSSGFFFFLITVSFTLKGCPMFVWVMFWFVLFFTKFLSYFQMYEMFFKCFVLLVILSYLVLLCLISRELLSLCDIGNSATCYLYLLSLMLVLLFVISFVSWISIWIRNLT